MSHLRLGEGDLWCGAVWCGEREGGTSRGRMICARARAHTHTHTHTHPPPKPHVLERQLRGNVPPDPRFPLMAVLRCGTGGAVLAAPDEVFPVVVVPPLGGCVVMDTYI